MKKSWYLAKAALLNAGLKAGDGVRFSPAMGLALEKIDPANGQEYFLESTPSQTFSELGGLDREIAQLQRQLMLHVFQADMASRYKVPQKKSALFAGPPETERQWSLALPQIGWPRFRAVGAPNLYASSPGRFTVCGIRPVKTITGPSSELPERPQRQSAKRLSSCSSMKWIRLALTEVSQLIEVDDRIMAAFLAELDGLENRGNIIVLAATNRLDCIDPALLRPGRLGDLVLNFSQPRAKAARAILERHLPADVPYALNGHGPEIAREELLDRAVAQLFAQTSETELLRLTMRDGKHVVVRAADLVSGAHLASIAQSTLERACVREAEGGPAGVAGADVSAAIADFFEAAPRANQPAQCAQLHPRSAAGQRRSSRRPVEHKVKSPHCYIVEAA